MTQTRARVASASVVAALLAVQLHAAAALAARPPEASLAAVRVLELTNAERHKAGLTPLAMNEQLTDAAQLYSEVLATDACFAHTCGPVPDMSARVGLAGYAQWTALAENIAAGQQTPEAVVAGWLASEGHRINILNARYTEIGVGVAVGGSRYGTYWTQNFGTRPASRVLAMPVPVSIAESSESPGSDTTAAGDS